MTIIPAWELKPPIRAASKRVFFLTMTIIPAWELKHNRRSDFVFAYQSYNDHNSRMGIAVIN